MNTQKMRENEAAHRLAYTHLKHKHQCTIDTQTLYWNEIVEMRAQKQPNTMKQFDGGF